jgi:hypothetical protein
MTHDRPIAGSRAAAWLALAATPVFALMAAMTGSPANAAHQMSCSAATHMSSLGGMALMYALMSAFHCPPWLTLICRWRSALPVLAPRGDSRANPGLRCPTHAAFGEAPARLSSEGYPR